MAVIPQDLLDRIQALEREVRELRGRSQIRPRMNQILGDVTIGEGGSLEVRSPDGTVLTRVGRVFPDFPDGTPQQGLYLCRRDGSLALTVRTSDPDKTPIQPVRIYDRERNVVVSDDVVAQGLARPYIPYTVFMNNQFTDKTDWEGCYHGFQLAQHPCVAAYITRVISGDSGGQVRLLINDQVMASGQSVQGYWKIPGYQYGNYFTLEIQARRTGKATRVWPRPWNLYGVESRPTVLPPPTTQPDAPNTNQTP